MRGDVEAMTAVICPAFTAQRPALSGEESQLLLSDQRSDSKPELGIAPGSYGQ